MSTILPGLTMCNLCRSRAAECALDDEALCIECADLVLERWIAVAANPELRTKLPPLREMVR